MQGSWKTRIELDETPWFYSPLPKPSFFLEFLWRYPQVNCSPPLNTEYSTAQPKFESVNKHVSCFAFQCTSCKETLRFFRFHHKNFCSLSLFAALCCDMSDMTAGHAFWHYWSQGGGVRIVLSRNTGYDPESWKAVNKLQLSGAGASQLVFFQTVLPFILLPILGNSLWGMKEVNQY